MVDVTGAAVASTGANGSINACSAFDRIELIVHEQGCPFGSGNASLHAIMYFSFNRPLRLFIPAFYNVSPRRAYLVMAFVYRFLGDKASGELARERRRSAVKLHNTQQGNTVRHVPPYLRHFSPVCTTECVGQTGYPGPRQRRLVLF